MSENKFIPNSFQVPNVYVDEIFPLLDDKEKSIMIFACRKIFGWQKRTDRISISQFSEGCNMHQGTVSDRLKNLVRFGILKAVSKNNPKKNTGVEWMLQLDSELINWDEMRARYDKIKENNKSKMAKIRLDTSPCDTDLPLCDSTTPTLCDSTTPPPVAQSTQNTEIQFKNNYAHDEENLIQEPENIDCDDDGNPLKKTRKQKKVDVIDGMMEYAGINKTPLEKKISIYPPDVQQTLSDLVDIYGWPAAAIPEKSKGGNYALWIKDLKHINEMIQGYGRRALEATLEPCGKLSPGKPGSIIWCIPGIVGKMSKKQETAKVETAFSEHMKNFVPRRRDE